MRRRDRVRRAAREREEEGGGRSGRWAAVTHVVHPSDAVGRALVAGQQVAEARRLLQQVGVDLGRRDLHVTHDRAADEEWERDWEEIMRRHNSDFNDQPGARSFLSASVSLSVCVCVCVCVLGADRKSRSNLLHPSTRHARVMLDETTSTPA